MRIARTFQSAALAVAVLAGSAWAHPQTLVDLTIPPEAGVEGGFYYWSSSFSTGMWEETNGKVDEGMLERYRSVGLPPDAGRATGFQMHHVCYNSSVFTWDPPCTPADGCVPDCADVAPGPDCLNCHHDPDFLFSYLPWGHFEAGRWISGSPEDCTESWGGTFVERDTMLFGDHNHENSHHAMLTHINTPAGQCFPPCWGRERSCECDPTLCEDDG